MGSDGKALAIVGATATGKSSLALELAEQVGGEIINADALQVYRGLDIGTAKPGALDLARVPHHLIDILDPQETYSAGIFARLATSAIADIEGRGSVPILVGGSGLYLRALTAGLAEIPEVPAAIRDPLRERWSSEGSEVLHGELERADPETASRVAPGDSQRVLRALEVFQATGKTQSWWLRQPAPENGLTVRCFGLTLARSILYDRIELRVDAMLRRGWLREVERLLESGVSEHDPAFRAIGYRELSRHLASASSLEQARAAIITATRRYAKRQGTWFKRETGVRWLEVTDRDRLLHLIRLDCSL